MKARRQVPASAGTSNIEEGGAAAGEEILSLRWAYRRESNSNFTSLTVAMGIAVLL